MFNSHNRFSLGFSLFSSHCSKTVQSCCHEGSKLEKGNSIKVWRKSYWKLGKSFLKVSIQLTRHDDNFSILSSTQPDTKLPRALPDQLRELTGLESSPRFHIPRVLLHFVVPRSAKVFKLFKHFVTGYCLEIRLWTFIVLTCKHLLGLAMRPCRCSIGNTNFRHTASSAGK